MACLNCTTRVLRIFLHTSPLPLRPPPLLRLPKPSYARLTTHLTATTTPRKQSTLATLGGELTDDDYIPFEYHLADATVPAAIGADVQSGWPPPVPEAGRMEREPDIELTSPHEDGGAWWGGVEERTVAVEKEKEKKKEIFLKRQGYWTLDGGEQTYSLPPKKNKGKRKREREKTLAAAAAAAMASSAEKRIELAPAEQREIESAPAEEKEIDAAERKDAKEFQDGDSSTNNIEADFEENVETASPKATRKAARKAARKAWEEKKAARDARISLKEGQKAARSLEKNQARRARRAAEREAAGVSGETVGESLGAHKYDQFFSDTQKPTTAIERTQEVPRDPRRTPKFSKNPKSSPETPRLRSKLSLLEEKRLHPVLDVPESYELLQTTPLAEKWDLKIPEPVIEPTRLQKWIATAPRNKIQPWQIYKARLQEKFKGQAWAPPKKLSPDAQEAIRVLRKNHPEITTQMLADKFEVSGEAIRRILRSKWREQVKTPERAQEWAEKWAKRGQKVWQRWEEAGIVHTKKTKNRRRLENPKATQERVKVEEVPTVDTSNLSDRLL